MKVITQLIDFFEAEKILTPEQIAYLAKEGFIGEHDFFEPEEIDEHIDVEEEGELEHLQKDLEAQPTQKKKFRRDPQRARRMFHRARVANKQLIR